MEQLRLFDPPQLLLGRYYRAIKNGGWGMLPYLMESIDKPENRPPDWHKKKLFWEEELSGLRENEKKPPKEMASFWETLLPKLQDEALKSEARYLERRWFTLLTDKLEDEDFDYLTGELHPVFCLMKIGQYRRANEMALRYFNKIGESAQLRTYHSFCLNKMKSEAEARTVLTFALFYDPFSVDAEFVFIEEIGSLLMDLRFEYQDSRLLRAGWPFESWLERLVDIAPDKELADRIAATYQGDLLTKDVHSEIDAQVYFNHLLYLAEVARKSSSLVSSEVVRLRNRMKNINAAALERYMERII